MASDLLVDVGGSLEDSAQWLADWVERSDFKGKLENHDNQVLWQSTSTTTTTTNRVLDELLDFPSDLEIQASSSSSNSSSSHIDQDIVIPTTTTPTPKLMCSRARQRFEIKTLRKQEQELREMLARLQQAPTLRCASPLAALVESVAESAGARKLVWQSVAISQRESLKRSQHENLRLRSSIVELKRLTKTVQRMITNRAVKSAVFGEHLLYEIPDANLSLSPDDHAMFRELLVDVDAIQANADTKLRALASSIPQSSSFRDWQMQVDSDGSLALEMVVYEELPFQKAQIEQAHIVLRHQEAMKGYRRFVPEYFGGRSDETLKVELINTKVSSGAGRYRQLHATRVAKEDTRTVVSSVGYINSVDARGRPAPGFLLKAQLWGLHTQHTRVEPHTGLEQHSTVLHVCVSLTAVQVRGPDSLRWDKSAAQRSIIPVWDREISMNQRRLENVLFDLQASARA